MRLESAKERERNHKSRSNQRERERERERRNTSDEAATRRGNRPAGGGGVTSSFVIKTKEKRKGWRKINQNYY